MNHRYFLLFVLLLLSVCSPSKISTQTFTDIAPDQGMDHFFSHWVDIGGGASFFDFDGDGDEDLYFTGGRSMDRLYRNEGDGNFTDVTIESGLEITGSYYTTGVTTGDIDNDGDRDIFVTTFGSNSAYLPNRRNLLFRNQGNGTFQEVALQANLGDISRSVGATFIDHDLDGFLDLYVINYIDHTSAIFDPDGEIIGFDHTCFENFFYHNNGNFTFTEVGAQLGVNDAGCALAVTSTDFDMDLDSDIYVANDFGEFVVPNQLFSNQLSSGLFDNVSESSGADVGLYGMGIAWSDYDLDQDIDYYITNIGSNMLLNNDGSGHYTNVAAMAGVENTFAPNGLFSTSWGAAFFDFDNNLYEDLFVSNGYIPAADFIATSTQDPNKLFYNNGDQTFTDISDEAGFNTTEKCRGLAYADFDNDGDVDFFVNVMFGNFDMPSVRLYRNDISNDNNWLKIKLQGTRCNRDAIGAQIKVYVDELVLIREVSGGGSHASQHSSIAHFGLADYAEIDSLQVAWPGGETETFFDLDINQTHTLIQATPPLVRINFSVDMRFQETSPDGVFLKITDSDGNTRQKLMYSPFQNDQYAVSLIEETGFSGHYSIINGRCEDGSCAEDLSEEGCGDPTMNFERILAPVTEDMNIDLCFGICPGLPCQSTIDTFDVHFSVNAASLGGDLETIYLHGIEEDAIPMQGPDEEGRFDLTLPLVEGYSTYFTYTNGDCPDLSCAEDLSGQECGDEANNFFRYLPPVTLDTTLLACFNMCDTSDCYDPIDTFLLEINLNMVHETVNPTGVFVVGDFFGAAGTSPLFDSDGDGVYSNTFEIEDGFSTYYSFSNGSDCPDNNCLEDITGQACAEPLQNNYRLLSPMSSDTIINTCFAECTSDLNCTPPDSVMVHFTVDMHEVEIATEGIYLTGSFDLSDEDLGLVNTTETIWETTLNLPLGTYYYRFANGDSATGTPEDLTLDIDNECTELIDGIRQRSLSISEDIPIMLDTTCFERCHNDCPVIIDDVSSPVRTDFHFMLQPNPANEKSRLVCCHAPFTEKSVTIFNVTGRVLANYSLSRWDTELSLSTNNLPPGIYWVALEAGPYRLYEKLVVQ